MTDSNLHQWFEQIWKPIEQYLIQRILMHIEKNEFFLQKIFIKIAKKNKKIERRKNHLIEIFSIYQKWINQLFLVDIELTKFDLDNLYTTVIEQMVPTNPPSTMKLKRLEERAISHLNCDDYIDAYNKFKEEV